MEKAPFAEQRAERVEFLEREIEKLKNQIEKFELDPDDYSDQFDELLDEQGEVKIGNLGYYPSYILKNCDPIAYRCGLNDFIDCIDIEDIEEYKDLVEELEELEIGLENLISEEE
jgi:hypothetical protein